MNEIIFEITNTKTTASVFASASASASMFGFYKLIKLSDEEIKKILDEKLVGESESEKEIKKTKIFEYIKYISRYVLGSLDFIVKNFFTIPLPFEKFINYKKSINLQEIAKLGAEYCQYLKTKPLFLKSNSKIFDIQPGDVIYFDSDYDFAFGHTSIALGQVLYYIFKQINKTGETGETGETGDAKGDAKGATIGNTKDYINETWEIQSIQIIFNCEIGFSPKYFELDDYLVWFMGNKKYGYSKCEQQWYNAKGIYYDRNSKRNKIKMIRYIGPKQDIVRATVAILSHALFISKSISFSGFFCLLTSLSFSSFGLNKRLQEYKNAINTKTLVALCSGFSSLVYQLSFHILGFSNDEILEMMPVNCLGFRPSDFLKLPNLYSKYWTNHIIDGARITSFNIKLKGEISTQLPLLQFNNPNIYWYDEENKNYLFKYTKCPIFPTTNIE